MAHIIVPTFIDSFDNDFDKDVYENVIRILKALKNTDSSIVEYFKMKNMGKKYVLCFMFYVFVLKEYFYSERE